MGGDKETSFARIPSMSYMEMYGADVQITLNLLGGGIQVSESMCFIVWDAVFAHFTLYVSVIDEIQADGKGYDQTLLAGVQAIPSWNSYVPSRRS